VKELAKDVWHLKCLAGRPYYGVNAYLVEDVLVDAGTRQSSRPILKQIGDRPVNLHALTHAHADHQGSSHELCTKLGVEYWVPHGDVELAENPKRIRLSMGSPNHPVTRGFWHLFHGPAHTVDRAMHEGDEIAGFKVIDAPGHSPGHVVLWRESDKVLIAGDVLANFDQLTLFPGLNEPKPYLTTDPKQNRDSARKLAKLEPELVCFGHGKPLRDTQKFVKFIEKLPTD
jgi:hydroxyacylglutathione hydrolase